MYTNLTHQGCANPDQDEGGLWCPTQLDEDGYIVMKIVITVLPQ